MKKKEKKKIVFTTQDLFPTGKEFVKLSKEKQEIFVKLLLSYSDTADDVLRLEAMMRGGVYEGPFIR